MKISYNGRFLKKISLVARIDVTLYVKSVTEIGAGCCKMSVGGTFLWTYCICC